MLSHLGHLAQQKSGRQVVLEFHPTARNEPAKKFLEEHGVLPAAGLGGSQAFPAEKVAAAKLNTDVEPPKPTATKSAAAKPKAAATTFDPAAFHAVALACDAAMVSAAAAAASEAAAAAAAAAPEQRQWQPAEVEALILEIVADLARGAGISISVSAQTPLMEAGVTSLMAIALAGKLGP